METLSPEVLDDLRHGRAPRERKIAVCSSGAHLPPADRAEVLSVLAEDSDEMISSRAQEALLSVVPEIFVEAAKRENAVPALFAYASRGLQRTPGLAEAMAANKNCPAEFLVPMVPYFSPAIVQHLLEELDRVTSHPPLALLLENSAFVTPEQKKILEDFRSTAIDEGHLADAAAEAEPDAGKRQTLLQQISRMTVAQRVQYAMKGSSEARRTLIRDSNKVVQRSVLQSPRLTDQEVEAFASMANLTDEILRLIANNRNFRKNYVVVRNLLNNPKTPLDVTLHMLPILNAMDLKRLAMNKNVPETLRSTAQKLQRTRASQKK
ncbi:MAG TPA: hypothetical protein VL128_11775 [Candidatus Eisenbacteria bacterium]|nr:hypothetical protein [Candidatus Eisenbacteria bacterium]